MKRAEMLDIADKISEPGLTTVIGLRYSLDGLYIDLRIDAINDGAHSVTLCQPYEEDWVAGVEPLPVLLFDPTWSEEDREAFEEQWYS